MSQINLDTSPYFDDFDADKDFYKVLFKPGFPVQARELTTLQSILQNQISSFGEHFFKEGSMVIPGGITYNPKYDAVVLSPQQGGIDVSLYLSELVGKTIRGEITGVNAKVIGFVLPPNEGVTNPTIFVSYTNSGNNSEVARFTDNEALINIEPVVYGNTTITGGSIFATTVSIDSTFVGSAANISSGIYFIRGTFVQVDSSEVILDPYSNTASYRVGLRISESIVTAGQDPSLYDNAKGFNNFSAPGADRLKITATLTKKPLDDFNDTNFVELLRIDAGAIKKLTEESDYNIIKDYLAQRTYDESGDYAVNGLGVSIDESLNDGLGNGGIYEETQKTEGGSIPSDDLAILKVSPGKAYVRGYDISVPSTVNIDAPKPRTTATVGEASVPFEMGSQFVVNNTLGTPVVGLDIDDNIIQLYDERLAGVGVTAGNLIGEARPYNYSLVDAPQSGPETPWNLYLFDLQIFTKVTLNVDATGKVDVAFRIRGLSSNATAFVKSVSATEVVLTEVSGEFFTGEAISVNGQTADSLSIVDVVSYSPADVKSVYQDCTSIDPNLGIDFFADTRLYSRVPAGFTASDLFTISPAGTVTCAGRSFFSFSVGDIISYQKEASTVLTYNRVTEVSPNQDSINIFPIASVAGVCDGTVTTTTIASPLRIFEAQVLNQENSFLYVTMEEENLSKVNLANSDILFSAQVTNQSTDSTGRLVVNTSALNVTDSLFVAFDQERYSVHYGNGTTATIESSQVDLLFGGNEVVITNLIPNQSSNITVNVTAVKSGIKSKTKVLLKSEELAIDKASSGIATATYGLTESPYYGLRVDDEELSLNFADVENIVAVYESLDSSLPVLDRIGFVNGLSLDSTTVKGELLRGLTSGATARLVTAPTSATLRIVYLSQARFQLGEVIKFSDSDIEAELQQVLPGNYNDITSKYTLDKGQREQFYDYSRLVRKARTAAPNKKLLVVFDRYGVPAGDKGDFYTVNSYSEENFNGGVPMLANGTIRASDTLDFRPRVENFTSTTESPFDYSARKFGSVGSTPPLVPAPNESTLLGYDYYLARKDRLVLNSLGQFKLVQGIPAKTPQLPADAEAAMEIARITYPPYLYNVDDTEIETIDNRRYTMRDIGGLEQRIENLEETTTLSLLERQTDSLQVLDADGNSRFKSGFFADDFRSADFVDFENPDCKTNVVPQAGAIGALSEFSTVPLRPQLQDGLDENDVDFSENLPLIDSNTKKTGDMITLDYSDGEWIKQPLASRIENVNPFNVILYNGGTTLTPASDDFVVTRDIDGRRVDVFGESADDFSRTFVEGIEVAQFMRERNIGFSANSLRPNTRFYPFFEGASGVDIIPKLVEIGMRSGTFEVGETVRGFNGEVEIFSARVAAQNHKGGPFASPTRTYGQNPYNRDELVPASYSASSSILNIDIDSLANIADDRFIGLIASGTRLVGDSSGAVANVSQIRLLTDSFGELSGAFFFRDPYATPAPTFRLRTGVRTFRLTSSPTNETPTLGGTIISFSDTTFTSGGTVQNRVVDQITIRDLPAPPPPVIIDNTVTVTNTIVIDRTVTVQQRVPVPVPRPVPVPIFIPIDPLAQTFRVDETGAFLTGLDLFFSSKSETDTLTVQIRATELGVPVDTVLQDFAQVTLEPSQINVSEDASVPTGIFFPSPIYLEPGLTYAVVLLAPTTNDYTAWIARMGEENITTEVDGAATISQQYINGSLFKSQNGQVWTPSQFEDLKFTLYKAVFSDQPGTVYLNNPPQAVSTRLENNPIKTLPRKLRLPIQSTTYDFKIGDKIASTGLGAPTVVKVYSDLEGIGGPVSDLVITSSGVAYKDGSYSNVELFNINGSGVLATADINVFQGEIVGAFLVNGGEGYKVGDTVGIVTSTMTDGEAGGDAVLTINAIGSTDTLYLTNATGEEILSNDVIKIYNTSTGDLIDTGVGARNTSFVEDPMYSGNVFVLDLPAHGMQANENIVVIQGVLPDTLGTQLTEPIEITTNTISVVDNTSFRTFEGLTTSTGYAYVGGEIIEYVDNGDGTLGITSRGVDNTSVNIHNQGDSIYKYELSGVSLRRINTQHNLPTDELLGFTRDINTLPLVFDRTVRPGGPEQVNFDQEQQAGGNSAFSSQNFQYTSLLPSVGLLTPGDTTNIESNLRSVSGTSAGGNEQSFVDQGFEPVALNEVTLLSSPRLVASRINEINYLQDIPNSKSFTLALRLSSSDSNLSPVIDLSQTNAIVARAALNNPVRNYATDPSVNLVVGDPHSSIYISKRVDLANPATSLKVLLSAYRDASADFRVLYRLFGASSQGSTEPTWELFPGYDNIVNGEVVDFSKNSGLPNKRVKSSAVLEVLEYGYEVDQLPEFQGFQIKIVFSGTNEARAPFIQDIRGIALA